MVMLFAENGKAPVEGRAGAIQSRSRMPLVDGRFSRCRRNIGISLVGTEIAHGDTDSIGGEQEHSRPFHGYQNRLAD